MTMASDDGVRFDDRGSWLRLELTGSSLTDETMAALHRALDEAARAGRWRMVALCAVGPVFCSGMDIAGAAGANVDSIARATAGFAALLRRFTETPVLVVAGVDGSATGGGVGLAAASDLVLAGPHARFALPELLWGLVPCAVLPFLIRRVGFQAAYAMTLTARTVAGQVAEQMHLVDETVADVDAALPRLAGRLERMPQGAVADAKSYLRHRHAIDPGAEQLAAAEIARLVSAPAFRGAAESFASTGQLPWLRDMSA